MNVLHILEATRGGTRRHILDLLPALQRRGVHCTLIGSPLRNPDFAGDAESLRSRGVRVIEVAMARGIEPTGDARALRQIGEVLKSQSFDLIHCHSTKAGLLGRLARLLYAPRIPLVYTPHCIAFDTGLPHAQRRAARILEKALAWATTHYIAVSHRERHAILSRGLCQPSRVTTIHNGIDLQEFDALPQRQRSEFGFHEADFVIGCFGRLTRQKNQTVLLKALPFIARQAPQVKAFFVGGGEDEPELRSLARDLGIAERLIWAGEQNEARPLYALCDVVAQPSRWEGCPYSVLEAMAARRTVVARSIGGVEEIIGSACGIAYGSSGVPHAICLADRINSCATPSPDGAEYRADIGLAARRRVEDCFRLERMVERTLEVYNRSIHP